MQVKSKFYVKFFRFAPLLILAMIAIVGYDYFSLGGDARNSFGRYSIFIIMISLLISFNLYYLYNLAESLSLESNIQILKIKSYIEKEEIINPIDIDHIEITNGNSHQIIFVKKDKGFVRLNALGLNEFVGAWKEPSFSDLMPLNPTSRATYKIAYNLRLKYNIPFETPFILFN